MILSKAINIRNGVDTRELTWEEAQRFYRSLFLGGEELDVSKGTAERLSPIAGAHRILTNSFAAIPFGVFCKDGDARVAVDDQDLNQVLKIRPNTNMSPFICAKTWMSNAFWHGWGAVWNRRDGSGTIVDRLPLPTECAAMVPLRSAVGGAGALLQDLFQDSRQVQRLPLGKTVHPEGNRHLDRDGRSVKRLARHQKAPPFGRPYSRSMASRVTTHCLPNFCTSTPSTSFR